ncbi:hypothetical protein BJ508DRAFT_311366 [Ascobolus immersus RN42]|uniref:Uncharacterized protein n=1 Tax=Ascobolus immersus RN42 TaxID=1160509 RepID=A0A3N4HUG1_ASCIM|nr:hypothetical protein BJ508DRAFT_311366 [Ascobolus immersus RN42]
MKQFESIWNERIRLPLLSLCDFDNGAGDEALWLLVQAYDKGRSLNAILVFDGEEGLVPWEPDREIGGCDKLNSSAWHSADGLRGKKNVIFRWKKRTDSLRFQEMLHNPLPFTPTAFSFKADNGSLPNPPTGLKVLEFSRVADQFRRYAQNEVLLARFYLDKKHNKLQPLIHTDYVEQRTRCLSVSASWMVVAGWMKDGGIATATNSAPGEPIEFILWECPSDNEFAAKLKEVEEYKEKLCSMIADGVVVGGGISLSVHGIASVGDGLEHLIKGVHEFSLKAGAPVVDFAHPRTGREGMCSRCCIFCGSIFIDFCNTTGCNDRRVLIWIGVMLGVLLLFIGIGMFRRTLGGVDVKY